MTKLSGLERAVLVVTLCFLLVTVGWFLLGDADRTITRIQVENPPDAVQTLPQPQNPAPGILEGERINLNTTSAGDLTRLPGIGEVKAQAIVTYRETQGPFETPEELTRVSGIGEATLEKLKPYITVTDAEGGGAYAQNSGGG